MKLFFDSFFIERTAKLGTVIAEHKCGNFSSFESEGLRNSIAIDRERDITAENQSRLITGRSEQNGMAFTGNFMFHAGVVEAGLAVYFEFDFALDDRDAANEHAARMFFKNRHEIRELGYPIAG